MAELADLAALEMLATWDQMVMMPSEGAAARAHQLGALSRVAHERATGDDIGEWLAALDRMEPLGPAGSGGGAARSSTDRGPGDAAGRYEQALQRLTALADPVDRFFTDVMVMAEDEAVRRNRLALLSRVVRLMRPFADLTRVVAGEGKASPVS